MDTTLTTDTNGSTRSERLEARISKTQKDFIIRAAALQGQTLTDFVVASAYGAAQRAIQAHESISLGQRDRETLIAALLNPPEPSESLKRAVQRSHAQVER